ncbi:hypothetical protein V8E54_008682 [Elaphomyces granulatus]
MSPHHVELDCFRRQSDEFMRWLAQKPGVRINPKIKVADLRSQGSGRGVVALSNISSGEELFAIPRNVVLSVNNSRFKNLISQSLEDLGPWLSLIVVMIYEYLLSEDSAWSAYFQVLPTSFDTLMFWSKSELSELQASAIVNRIGKQDAEDSVLELVAPIVRSNPTLFPPLEGLSSYEGTDGNNALLDLAHRMGSLIMAYAFDIEDDSRDGSDEDGYVTDDEQLPKGMVPLADLLNADADRNNARLFQEEKFLVMRSINDIKAGEELLNDYGQIPRADLLRRYGYITANYAKYDVVELPLGIICEAAGLDDAELKDQAPLQFLEDLGILDDGYSISKPSSNQSLAEYFPVELLSLINTLTLTREQLLEYRSKNSPPDPVLRPPQAHLLLQAVQRRWLQYSTSIEQDIGILGCLLHTESMQVLERSLHRKRMAIYVRIGEKEIFRQLSTTLTNFISISGANSSMKRNAQSDDDERPSKVRSRSE